MNIIDMARASGLTVILDGRIGREEYQSVCGSVSALERFADSLNQCVGRQRDSARHRALAARVFGRFHRRIRKIARVAGAMATPVRRLRRALHRSLK